MLAQSSAGPSVGPAMRIFLRLAALAVAVVTVALWFFGGPNRGWTKTSVPVPEVDPVLGSYERWEKRFVPGVDFLAAGSWARRLSTATSPNESRMPGR